MATPDDFFNITLDAFRCGKMAAYAAFDLGPSPHLQLKELPRANIYLHQAVLRKAINKHAVDLAILRNLPTLMSKPVKLFHSKTEPGSIIYQLDLMCHGEIMVAATLYTEHPELGTCHMVKTLHHRDRSHFSQWEAEGLLIYKK